MAHVEAVPQILIYFAQLPDIVASLGQRIWSERIPDQPSGGPWQYPYAKVNEIAPDNLYTHDGPSGRKINLQIDVYDDQQARADSATELLRSALDDYRGMAGSLTIGRSTAKVIKREWSESARRYWRVIAVEIGTNDT